MCSMLNPVPQLFDWDAVRNQPGDRWARSEINHSVVEFVAPTEYMVRPPQPAVYVFLIDVSHAAMQSGQFIGQCLAQTHSFGYMQAWLRRPRVPFLRTWTAYPIKNSA